MAMIRFSTSQTFILVFFHVTVTSLYLKTMYPGVGGGDSGELVASVCSLSVAHPPGYPLYQLILVASMSVVGLVWPDANPAWRANFTNASIAGFAATGVVILTILLSDTVLVGLYEKNQGNKMKPKFISAKAKNDIKKGSDLGSSSQGGECFDINSVSNISFYPALMAGIMFATSPSIWEYATHAEVFSLNNFLCGALLSVFILYMRRLKYSSAPSRYYTALLGLVSGLCISNQHTSIFYLITCIPVACFYRRASLLRHKWALFYAVTAGILGLSPYAYLIHRSFQRPLDGWGDQRNIDGFLTHFFRREYGTFHMASEWESGEYQTSAKFVRRLGLFFSSFQQESFQVGIVLAGIFICTALPQNNTAVKTIIVAYFIYAFALNKLANLSFSELHVSILKRMWQQSTVLAMAFAGSGLSILCVGFKRKYSHLVKVVLPYLTICLFLVQIRRYYTQMDHSETRLFGHYAKDLLDSIPQNALLLANDDMNCNIIHYLQRCEDYRPDIDFIRLPLITYEWWKPMQLHHFHDLVFPADVHHPYKVNGFAMKDFLKANVPRKTNDQPANTKAGAKQVFVAGEWKSGDQSQDIFQRIPVGLADEVFWPKDTIKLVDFSNSVKSNFEKMQNTISSSFFVGSSAKSWELVVQEKYVHYLIKASHFIAERVFTEALSSSDQTEVLDVAMLLYEKLLILTTTDATKNNMFFAQRAVWRNAGLCAGVSGNLKRYLGQEDESVAMAKKMFSFWARFLKHCVADGDDQVAQCTEIARFVYQRVNPYSNQSFRQKYDWDFADSETATILSNHR